MDLISFLSVCLLLLRSSTWPVLGRTWEALQTAWNQVLGLCLDVGLLSADMGRPYDRALGPSDALSSTCDHRVWKTGLPVRSAVLKPHAGELVVGWVTTSESSLLYVFVFVCSV